MHSALSIATEIVRREGGYVNDPDDLGGATNYGVTIHTMRRLKLDKNKDGKIDTRDVRLLTQQDAIEIFLREYLRRPRIDELPQPLQATVFDMQVNAGNNAIKILQRLYNQVMPKGPRLVVDGALGPKSIGAITTLFNSVNDPQKLVDAYGIARRNYYFRIADRRARNRKYVRTRSGGKGGWIKRAEEFISTRNHMTAAQFKARTKHWR